MNKIFRQSACVAVLASLLLLSGCSDKSDVISGLLGVSRSGDPLNEVSLSIQQSQQVGADEGVLYGYTITLRNNSSTDITSMRVRLDDVQGSVSLSEPSNNTWTGSLQAGGFKTTPTQWTYNELDLGTYYALVSYGTPPSQPMTLVFSVEADTETGNFAKEFQINVSTVDEGAFIFERLGHEVQPYFDGFYSDNAYLFGFDVESSNPTTASFPSLLLEITSVQPSNQVSEFSDAPRAIQNLSAGGSAIPDAYWCFDCNTADEVRIGNFYLVTTPTTSGASFTIAMRVEGVYGGNTYQRTFNYPMTVQGKAPAMLGTPGGSGAAVPGIKIEEREGEGARGRMEGADLDVSDQAKNRGIRFNP